MLDPTVLDTYMHSQAGLTAAFILRGAKTALVETGPKSTADAVSKGLADAGIDSLDLIVVTHVHLDHAGAAGTLARRFPEATVVVHEIGAPHLVDPSKLWSSAARIYGDKMELLWGGIDPIPAERVRAVADGDKIDLGGRSLQVIATPGHAWHHHAFVDDSSGIAFVGDALGVRLPDVGIVRPATPPPEFDLEVAVESIERLRQVQPTSLWLTHWGPADRGVDPGDVPETCERAIAALRAWEGWVRDARAQTRALDEASDRVAAKARAAAESSLAPAQVERLEQTSSYSMNTWGYMRYLDKMEG